MMLPWLFKYLPTKCKFFILTVKPLHTFDYLLAPSLSTHKRNSLPWLSWSAVNPLAVLTTFLYLSTHSNPTLPSLFFQVPPPESLPCPSHHMPIFFFFATLLLYCIHWPLIYQAEMESLSTLLGFHLINEMGRLSSSF